MLYFLLFRPLTPTPESELNFHGSFAPAVESPNGYSPADDSNYTPTLVIDEVPFIISRCRGLRFDHLTVIN